MIAPMLATEGNITDLSPFLTDDDWTIEQKLDGHRLLLIIEGGRLVDAVTRNGTSYTRRLPKALTEFGWPSGRWVLDGELIGDKLYLFDVPEAAFGYEGLSGTDGVRRAMALGLAVNLRNPAIKPVRRAVDTQQKIALAEELLAANAEGMVLKRKRSMYRYGRRTTDWLKLKFVTTADVVVTDVRADGKDSVGYSVYADGKLTEIGRASLIGKEKAGLIQVDDVIEVRYLYVGANGRLYQPTIVGKRTDKLPHECTGQQLRHVNKSVLEAL